MPTEKLFKDKTPVWGQTKIGGLTGAEKLLIAGAVGTAAIPATIEAGATSRSKAKAQYSQAAKTGLGAAMTGASIGRIGGLPGMAIGAGVGLVAGGLFGAIKGGKDYTAQKRQQRANERLSRYQSIESQAQQKRAAGVANEYSKAKSPKEVDVVTDTGLASNDMYKNRTYGG